MPSRKSEAADWHGRCVSM